MFTSPIEKKCKYSCFNATTNVFFFVIGSRTHVGVGCKFNENCLRTLCYCLNYGILFDSN